VIAFTAVWMEKVDPADGSLDLLSFWLIWLLATGFAVACRRTTGGAL